MASILLKLRKQNNLLHSLWQISLKNKENLLFLLCMNLEKIKNDGYFYFSKNIDHTWLKRRTFKLSQDRNDMFIRYLVPEIEQLNTKVRTKLYTKLQSFRAVLSKFYEWNLNCTRFSIWQPYLRLNILKNEPETKHKQFKCILTSE